ncbi:MAG: hypothetical protein II453_03185 [Alphaproteobacteria bacterium]|nr:hypothetical protein [Alphaproteobacteria bacterium]MBQ2395565.1 hypothetical protein [Bacteroidales bacterium]
MNRTELYQKFVALLNKMTNWYRNSDLDITDIEFDGLENWLKSIIYVLEKEPVDFDNKKLKSFENTYNNAEKEIYSKLA